MDVRDLMGQLDPGPPGSDLADATPPRRADPGRADLSALRSELQALSAAQKALRSESPSGTGAARTPAAVSLTPPVAVTPGSAVQAQMSKLQAGVLAHTQAVATFEKSRRAAEDALRRAAASVSASPLKPLHHTPTRGDAGSEVGGSVAPPFSASDSRERHPLSPRGDADLERGLALVAEAAERERALGERVATSVSPWSHPAPPVLSPPTPSQQSIDSRLLGAAIERQSELSLQLEACRSELVAARAGKPLPGDEQLRELEAEKSARQAAEAALREAKEELAQLRAELVRRTAVEAVAVQPGEEALPMATASFEGVPLTTAEVAEVDEDAPGVAPDSPTSADLDF